MNKSLVILILMVLGCVERPPESYQMSEGPEEITDPKEVDLGLQLFRSYYKLDDSIHFVGWDEEEIQKDRIQERFLFGEITTRRPYLLKIVSHQDASNRLGNSLSMTVELSKSGKVVKQYVPPTLQVSDCLLTLFPEVKATGGRTVYLRGRTWSYYSATAVATGGYLPW